jgi:two-component system chemotaxis sensor kinase CheA
LARGAGAEMAGDEMDTEKYKDLYLTEAYAHVAAMEEGVAALGDSAADSELLSSISRAAHTLKGMSATMGYEELAQLAGGVERLMDARRLEARAGAPELSDLLTDCIEALRTLLQGAVNGDSHEVDLDTLLRRMELLT